MKKKITLILLALSMMVTLLAVAETKSFSFAVVPTNTVDEYQVGCPAKKADNQQRFYVTMTSNGFSDNRNIYYISCDDTGRMVSNAITNSGNASYTTIAPSGYTYKLAYRATRTSSDSATLCAIVTGRWTP